MNNVSQSSTTKSRARGTSSKLNGAQRIEVKDVTPKDKVHAADTSAFEQAYARYEAARGEMLAFFNTAGWKRELVAYVSTVALAIGVASIGAALVDYMLMGAVLAGAGMFLQMAIIVIGVAITFVGAYKVAAKVGMSILSGEADRIAIRTYDNVLNFAQRINPFRREHRHA